MFRWLPVLFLFPWGFFQHNRETQLVQKNCRSLKYWVKEKTYGKDGFLLKVAWSLKDAESCGYNTAKEPVINDTIQILSTGFTFFTSYLQIMPLIPSRMSVCLSVTPSVQFSFLTCKIWITTCTLSEWYYVTNIPKVLWDPCCRNIPGVLKILIKKLKM